MTEDPTNYRGDPPAQAHDQPSYAAPTSSTPADYPPQGYPQQAYGPPPYGQQGYGPPPGYPPPGYFPRPTNTMAILALVFIFVFAPASVVLGTIARKQIRQTGEQGDGMALAGIIVGWIAIGLFVLLIVFWIIAFAWLTNTNFGP